MGKFIKLIFSLVFTLISLSAFAQTKELNPSLIRGPYLQSATSTSMVIRWRTNAMERGVVRYGLHKDSLNLRAENSEITMEHILTLKNLRPYTVYYYSIGGLTHVLQGGSENFFRTLPLSGMPGKYIIGAFGDCGNNSENQKDIITQVNTYLGKNYMDAWLLLGDNAYESGTDMEYQTNFFEVYQNDFLKKYPLFPAPGNHDYRDIDKYRGKTYSGTQVAYFKNFTMPTNGEAGGLSSANPAYYSFDIGNVHFISLDSYGREENSRMFDTLSRQVSWVKKDLAANKNKEWVVAYWHHPPYTMGSHNSDKETELIKIRENFIQILERNGVDMVICGHSHNYERSYLMNGHYGEEETFNLSKHTKGLPAQKPDLYVKDKTNKGTVYVVSGSSGKIDSKPQTSFPHKAMVFSDATHGGALLLEVEGSRLNLKWLGADGVVRDKFTMMKNTTGK